MKRTTLVSALSFAGAALTIPFAIGASGLLFNGSDSVPIGLYRKTPDGSGKYLAFCLSASLVRDAQRRGLELPAGSCPGGVAPILKPVVSASEQHPLLFTEQGFSVGGKLLRNTAPKVRSHTGAPLPHYPFGLYKTGLWAISTFNPDSFDSRYFGPLDLGAIRFHATPIWTE